MSGDHSTTHEPMDPERYQAAQRSTWVSAGVNVLLTIIQVVVGLLANAQSLVADGMHSASDLVADFMVLVANRHGSHPADSRHPYGHGRIETAASLILGVLLAATGAGMLFAAGSRLENVEHLAPVQPIALWAAIGTLAAKEGLFRYMLAVAERLRSPMLVANAWHARSDAASSLVVALGIAGSLMGYRFLDLLAAALVGFMIVRMGLKFAYDAMQELVDTGLSAEEVTAIRATLMATPGVMGVHELRTRRMGHQGLVDAHVRVDARISVSEGHRIAEDARAKVIAENEHVLDVLVHVDVEDDVIKPADAEDLPEREELMRRLAQILGPDTPQVDKALLHYLAHRVEADIFLPAAFCLDGDRVVALEQRIAKALRSDPHFSAISINCKVAPK